jgi:hypothetical protein
MAKKYKITSPDGKSIIISGDHKPSASEAEELFGQYHQDVADENAKKTAEIDKQTQEQIGKTQFGHFAIEHPDLAGIIGQMLEFGRGVQDIAKGARDLLAHEIRHPSTLISPRLRTPEQAQEYEKTHPISQPLIQPQVLKEPGGYARAAGQIAAQAAPFIYGAMRGTPAIEPEVLPPVEAPQLPEYTPETITVQPTELTGEIAHEPYPLGAATQRQLPQIIPPPEIPIEVTPEPRPILPREVPRLPEQKPYGIPQVNMQKAGTVKWPGYTETDVTRIPRKPGVIITPEPRQITNFDPATGVANVTEQGVPKQIQIDPQTQQQVQAMKQVSDASELDLLQALENDEAARTTAPPQEPPLEEQFGALAEPELEPPEMSEEERAQRKELMLPEFAREEGFRYGRLPEEHPAADLMNQRDELQTQLESTTDPNEIKTLTRQLEEINTRIHTLDTSRILGQPSPIDLPEVSALPQELPQELPQVRLPQESPEDFWIAEVDKQNAMAQKMFGKRMRELTRTQQNQVIDAIVNEEEMPEEIEAVKKSPEIATEPLIVKTKKASDRILANLKDESGVFDTTAFRDIVNNIGKDNKFKNYVAQLQEKIARGEKLSPEELESMKGSKLHDAVLTYEDRSGALNKLKVLFGSADKNLEQNPWTKPIADYIKGTSTKDVGEIPKEIFKSQVYGIIDNIRGKFLTSKEKEQVGILLDNFREIPLNLKGFSPKALDVADGYRKLLDSIWDFAKAHNVVTRAGKMPGTINEYFTHIMNQPDLAEELKASIAALFDPIARGEFKNLIRDRIQQYYNKEQVPLTGEQHGEQVYVRPKPTPTSPFIERRTGELTNIEYNSDRVMRAYVESLARLIYDKPAVLKAREVLERVPKNTTLWRNANWYIRNYAGYDALDLSNIVRNVTGAITGMGTRSILPFSVNLQMLHLARSVGQVIPEALSTGPLNVFNGFAEFAKNPIQAVRDARNAGMLQQSQIPIAMKRVGEEFDQIGNFFDAGNTIAKSVALKIGQQIYPNDPKKAADWAMRAEGATTPARQAEIFEQTLSKLIFQFKYWAQKYGELHLGSYVRALDKPTLNNWISALSYTGSLIGLLYLTEKLGVRLAHLGFQTFQIGSPIIQAITRAMTRFRRDDYAGGIEEFLKYVIPAGQSKVGKFVESKAKEVLEPTYR